MSKSSTPAISAVEAPPSPNWVEKATLIVAGLALVGTAISGFYVLLAKKEYVEADKLRAELALHRMKRAEVSASLVPASDKPWGERNNLCTIGGSYKLKNVGNVPIKIAALMIKVLEADLGQPPAGDAQVTSISFNTRVKQLPLFEERLPDSDGVVLPGEEYSRAYGYIIRRDAAKQYATEVSPLPVDRGDFDPKVFRAWSPLIGICIPNAAGSTP